MNTATKTRRNPFGVMDVPAPNDAEVTQVARTATLDGSTDDDNAKRIGVFCEFIREGWWFRDDYAFFDRVPPHVRVEALCTGHTTHDGYKLDLEQLENVPHIPRPPVKFAEPR